MTKVDRSRTPTRPTPMLSLHCKVSDADSHAITALHCILTCKHMTCVHSNLDAVSASDTDASSDTAAHAGPDASFTAASYLLGSINGSLTIVALILGDGTFFIFITDALRVFGNGYTGAPQ